MKPALKNYFFFLGFLLMLLLIGVYDHWSLSRIVAEPSYQCGRTCAASGYRSEYKDDLCRCYDADGLLIGWFSLEKEGYGPLSP